MRAKILIVLGVAALLLAFSSPVKADSTLFINGGAGDPNLISGGSFVVLQNSGGASVGTIANLLLLFSVPGVTSTGTGGITVSTSGAGTASLFGILANTSPPCKNASNGLEVYSCASVPSMDVFTTTDSNSLGNFNTAELAHNGFTATSYGIYGVTITGANLGPSSSISVAGVFPLGTFVDAFGMSNTGKNFSTPFTEAGLVVPEPGTLALFGIGLLGLAAAVRRRVRG